MHFQTQQTPVSSLLDRKWLEIIRAQRGNNYQIEDHPERSKPLPLRFKGSINANSQSPHTIRLTHGSQPLYNAVSLSSPDPSSILYKHSSMIQ